MKSKVVFKMVAFFMFLLIISNTLMAQNATNTIATDEENAAAVAYINQLDATVRKNNAIVKVARAQDLTRLPIGIMDPTGANLICIDSAKFNGNTGGFFNAYMAVTIPGLNGKFCFRATNIPFGPNGITTLNGVALTLVSTHKQKLGDGIEFVLPGNGNNNIQWDCNGFKEANLEGKFVFTKYLLVDKMEAPTATEVVATFSLQHIVNFKNMVAAISITPFTVKGTDFGFKVTDATLDFSDFNNPSNFVLPPVYQEEYGTNINLWRGFYLRNLMIRTPFKRNNDFLRINANNIIIDKDGLTGSFNAANVLPINEGSLSGWGFGIDFIEVEFLRNKLISGKINGDLKTPLINESFGYTGSITTIDNKPKYVIRVELSEDLVRNTPLKTHIKLIEGSYIEVEQYGDNLVPRAYFNGYISSRNVDFPDSDTGEVKEMVKKVTFKGVKFENLLVSTEFPYVHSGTFSYTDSLNSNTLGGFKISLTEVKMSFEAGHVKLGFKARLNFMDSTVEAFSANAGFTFKAQFVQHTTPVLRQTFEFRGVQVDEIGIKVNTGSFKLDGTITFFRDDADYGNGFRGGVTMLILPGEGKLNLNASAQVYFGKKDGMRYWQASAFASSTSLSIPLVPPVLNLNGFLGGVSWHMKKKNVANFSQPVMLNDSGSAMTDVSDWARQAYIPDANSGLSIMVGITFAAQKENLLSGAVALEVGLNANWGLNFIELRGLVSMFKNINDIDPELIKSKDISSAAAFRGEVLMLYDAPNRTFHANIAAYLNLEDKVKGSGPNNLIGEMVIHISPSEWYVYVGRPSNMLGVNIYDFGTVQAYFMVGENLEGFPNPPAEILQNISYTPMVSATNLKEGSGVAFGARINSSNSYGMEEGSTSWLYAGYSIGAGADVMLSTSGNYTCDGAAVGFGGWWARGQAYAYVQGVVGIRVKVFKKRKNIDLVSLSAGILLEAKIPKPAWFRGFGYLNFNILGGLIKGRLSFKVQIGKECVVVSNPGGDRDIETKVISGTFPTKDQNNVEVFSLQAITTNIPANSIFEQLDDDGNVKNFKCAFGSFILSKNGVAVPGQITIDGKKVSFKPNKMLEPNTSYNVYVSFAYKKDIGNNVWTTVLNDDGSLAIEDTTFNFLTGPPTSNISMQNITSAYPFSEMENFYKNEYAAGQGYMKISNAVNLDNVLHPGPITNGIPTYEYKFKIKNVSGNSNEEYLQPVIRNDYTLSYDMPANLQNNNVYRLSLIRKVTGITPIANVVDNSLIHTTNNTDSSQNAYYTDTIASDVLAGPIVAPITEMFNFHFRVSKFNTFAEKVNSMQNTTQNVQDIAVGNILLIGAHKSTNGELFDNFELKGLPSEGIDIDGEPLVLPSSFGSYANNFPMIKLRADSNNSWFQNDILPRVYPNATTTESGYYRGTVTNSAMGLNNLANAASCIGLPGTFSNTLPLNRVSITHNMPNKLPQGSPYDRLMQSSNNSNGKTLLIKYNIPYFASLDYKEMYYAGVCNWLGTSTSADKTPGYTSIIESGGVFPQIRTGTYAVKLSYTLPGNKQTSTATLTLTY